MKYKNNTRQGNSVFMLDLLNTPQLTYWDQFKAQEKK